MTGMRIGGVVVALSMLGGGCATEEWTVALFSKRQAEVDTTLADHGQRIDQVEGRVAEIEVTLTETRDQVRDALATPATAPGRKVTPWMAVRPPADPATGGGRTVVLVIPVPFGFDRADLDATAEAALTSIMSELRARPSATIELEGTTDSVGRYEYNVRLSQRRIAAVKRWLTHKGVDQGRIVGATSRGPLVDPSVKDSAKRRVTVKLIAPPDN